MKTPRRFRIALILRAVTVLVLGAASGCSWMTERATLDPNRARRFPSLIRRKPSSPPVVNLGVEPISETPKVQSQPPTIAEPALPPF